MKSEYFYCPRCKTQMKKSPAVWMMGEAENFISLGVDSTTTCPACGCTIDVKSMSDGKYDRLPLTAGDVLNLATIGGVIAGIVVLMQFDFGLWTALGLSATALIAVRVTWSLLRRLAAKR